MFLKPPWLFNNTVRTRLLSILIGQKKLVRPILNIHEENFFSANATPEKRKHIWTFIGNETGLNRTKLINLLIDYLIPDPMQRL